jgi:hypothetical protein
MLEEGLYHPSEQGLYTDVTKADNLENDNIIMKMIISFLQSFVSNNNANKERIQKVVEFHKQQFIYDDFVDDSTTTEMV